MSIHVANLVDIFSYAALSFLIALVCFPWFIRFVENYKLTQKIREDGLSGGVAKLFRELHSHKAGTPTMGGMVVVFAVLSVVLISQALFYFGVVDYSILNRGETYLPLFTLAFVGVLGMVDDFFLFSMFCFFSSRSRVLIPLPITGFFLFF